MPSAFEQGAWKVYYIGQVIALRNNSKQIHHFNRNVTLLRNLLHDPHKEGAKEDAHLYEDGEGLVCVVPVNMSSSS